MSTSSFFRRIGACAAVLTALGLASCSSSSSTSSTAPVAQTVTVVGENTPQAQLLTEIYAQALDKAGFRVARRADVADLAAGYAALKSGAADLFITHTAELLAYVVKAEPAAAASTSTTAAPTTTTTTPTASSSESSTTEPATTAPATTTTVVGPVEPTTTGNASATTAVDTTTTAVTPTTVSTVGQAAAESINGQSRQIGEILPADLQIGTASDAEDKAVIACSGAIVTTGYLSNLSDLAGTSNILTIAGPASFETDPNFGLPGFEKAYRGTFKKFIPVTPDKIGAEITPPTTTSTTAVSTTVAAGATTTSVASGASTTSAAATTTTTTVPLPSDADCGAFTSSLDPTIPSAAVVMDDNLNWIETNGVIPLVTKTGYTPGVQQLIDQVSQTLTTTSLRSMLKSIADQNLTPAEVASQYVASAGLGGQ